MNVYSALVARLGGAILVIVAAVSVPQAAERQSAVSHFVLDNGLEVVVIPDRRAPVVTHMLWYKVGSADEDPGKSGIAHFFEHLMFKGTTNHPPGAFAAAVASVGGQENAFTSYDYTAYYQQVAPGELGTMMRFEADRMRNLVLSQENIETERQVVLEERSQRTDNVPRAILSEEVNATLYQNHPYRTPIIGWRHEVERLTQDDLNAFYDRFYTPNNAILVVAGDVDAETVRGLAQDSYGKIARGPDLPPRARPMEPQQKTARTVTLKDPRVSVPSVSIHWHVPAHRMAAEKEFEALALLSEIFGQGTRSRLYQELVVRQGIAAQAGSYLQSPAYDYSNLVIYAEPRGEADLAMVEKALDNEIAKIIENGVNAEELAAARQRLLRDRIFSRDSQQHTASLYGSVLATGGTVDDVDALPERLAAITADDVRAAAQRYLDRTRAVRSYLLPSKEDPA